MVDRQPNSFRVPSPSDTDDDSEMETTNHRNTREPSLELLSSKHITNATHADRIASEDVVVVSQSRVTNGDKNRENHVDLTEVDPPGSSPLQALVVEDESSADAPSAIVNSNGKGTETIAPAQEPVRSSGTYKLDYSEDEDDDDNDDDNDDASHESDEDHYYERPTNRRTSQDGDSLRPHSCSKANDEPSSAPDDLDLIEDLLELDGSEDGRGERMSDEDSNSVKNDESGKSIGQTNYQSTTCPPVKGMADEEVPADDDDEEMTASESGASLNGEDSLFDEHEKESRKGYGLQESRVPNGGLTSSPVRDQTDERDMISVYDSTEMDTDYSSPDEDMDDEASIMEDSDLSDEEPYEDETDHQHKARTIPVTKSTQYDTVPATTPYGKLYHTASQRAPSPSDAAMAKPTAPPFLGGSGKREQYIPPSGQITTTDIEGYPRVNDMSYMNGQFYYPPPLPPMGSTFSTIPAFVQGDPITTFGAFDSGSQPMHPYFPMSRFDHGQPNIHLDVRPTVNDDFQNHQSANLRHDGKSSKVHISDIVNSSPAVQPLSLSAQNSPNDNNGSTVAPEKGIELEKDQATTDVLDYTASRVPKRKAAEMEDTTEEPHADSVIHQAVQDDVLVEKSQSSSIPDAQPRETVAITSQIVEDSLPSLEELGKQAQNATDSQQNGAADGDSAASRSGTFQLTSSRGEPPHKKQKTPAKPLLKPTAKQGRAGRAVKTFVSGCIAGAVTVVGAAAALIATMPTSVQEEALRSM